MAPSGKRKERSEPPPPPVPATPKRAAEPTSQADGQEEADEGRRALVIHRCRFMDWEPRGVVTMAASASGGLLAVARENGNVEIRRVNEKFRAVGVVQAAKEGLIRALAWSSDPEDATARLFVGSLDTSICEVDIRKLAVTHRRDSYGGAVWCLAARPKGLGQGGPELLAAGCEDGGVKLFSLADGGLEFHRALPSVNARVLSLAWQPLASAEAAAPVRGQAPTPSHAAAAAAASFGIYVGAVDGTIRHLDVATGHSAYRMTVESRNSLRPAMVWCLKALPDGTLVSGDSLGSVQFWDGPTGTLRQAMTLHEADVLALEASPSGDTVFAAGIDSKLICLRRAPPPRGQHQQQQAASQGQQHHHHYQRRELQGAEPGSGGMPWAVHASNRAHSHDVTALALVTSSISGKGHSKFAALPLLVSAGKDTKICTYSVGGFSENRPRYIAPYPYHPIASLAMYHPRRLFLMQHDRKLHLWRLGATQEETSALLRRDAPRPALEIQAADKGKAGGNVVCSALSPDGLHLAYATGEDARVFAIDDEEEGAALGADADLARLGLQPPPPRLTLRRLKRGLHGKAGVTAMGFTPDGRRLLAGTRMGTVLRMEMREPEEDEEGSCLIETAVAAAGAPMGDPVVLLAVSGNGKYVAAGRLGGAVDVYKTRDLSHAWTLPALDSPPTALSWHLEADVLAVACVSNRFHLFDNRGRQLADWSRDHGHALPKALLERHDCVLGITFSPGLPNALLVHGFGFLAYVDLDRPACRQARLLPETHPAAVAQRGEIEAHKQKRRWARLKEERRLKKQREAAAAAAAAATAGAGGEEEAAAPPVVAMNGNGGVGKREEFDEEEERWNVKLHLGYQGVLSVLPMGVDELLLVEEPWLKIVAKLPEVLHRSRYGT